MRSSKGRKKSSKSYRVTSRSPGLHPVSQSASLKSRDAWISRPGDVFVKIRQAQPARKRVNALRVFAAGKVRALARSSMPISLRIGASMPKRVKSLVKRPDVCLGRMVRRQVLFALGIGGFRRSPGSGGGYRRTQASSLRC